MITNTDTITIAHLYPDDMNVYGDSGNIVALRKRLEWRGYGCDVVEMQPGQPFDFADVDIVFGGGGQDSGQQRITADLLARGDQLRAAVADGMPMLLVCGLYQLFGLNFDTTDDLHLGGLGIFQATTRASATRLIGNIAVDTTFGPLVGFENHSGQTRLAAGQQPLGRVRTGWGNNEDGETEGAVTRNAIGTYLHGPVLPKNPVLTDHLILTALRRRGWAQELGALRDELERAAATASSLRPAKLVNDTGSLRPSHLLQLRWQRLRARNLAERRRSRANRAAANPS